MNRHSLALAYRGDEHRHRWLPSCSCGWVGIPKRRRRTGEADYHAHVRSAGRQWSNNGGRRAVTPREQLPEVLR